MHARERLQTAVLQLSGELGYRAVTLRVLLERTGIEPEEFHRQFRDLGDCFTVAYRNQADALCEEMLRAARAAGEWKAGTRSALDVVLRFVSARPALGKALVREVHVVGGRALTKHEEVLERLAEAVGSGCEPPVSALEKVPRAPSFIVGAVEGVIAGHLDRGEPEDLLRVGDELMYLIVASFAGPKAV